MTRSVTDSMPPRMYPVFPLIASTSSSSVAHGLSKRSNVCPASFNRASSSDPMKSESVMRMLAIQDFLQLSGQQVVEIDGRVTVRHGLRVIKGEDALLR